MLFRSRPTYGEIWSPKRSFESYYGVEPAGAVIVRPDGHVMIVMLRAPDCELALDAAVCERLDERCVARQNLIGDG